MFGKKFLRKLIIVSAIVVFAVLIMSVIDKSTLKLAYSYYTLTNKPSKSDSQFNIPTGQIKLNKDGTRDISFELSMFLKDSEIEVTEEDFEGADGVDDRQHSGNSNKEENKTVEGEKIVSILGDSISTFEGTMPDGYAVFYPFGSVTSSNDLWWSIYINSVNAKLGVNGSWSGSKVSGSDDSAGQSDRRINDLGNEGTPSIIIVYLGTNDLWTGVSQSEFGSAYETMLNKIKNKYPKSKVYCLGLTQLLSDPASGSTGLMDLGEGTSRDFSGIIKSKAEALGYTYVSLDSCWSYDKAGDYCDDGIVHPNKEGMKKIASKIPK